MMLNGRCVGFSIKCMGHRQYEQSKRQLRQLCELTRRCFIYQQVVQLLFLSYSNLSHSHYSCCICSCIYTNNYSALGFVSQPIYCRDFTMSSKEDESEKSSGQFFHRPRHSSSDLRLRNLRNICDLHNIYSPYCSIMYRLSANDRRIYELSYNLDNTCPKLQIAILLKSSREVLLQMYLYRTFSRDTKYIDSEEFMRIIFLIDKNLLPCHVQKRKIA